MYESGCVVTAVLYLIFIFFARPPHAGNRAVGPYRGGMSPSSGGNVSGAIRRFFVT